MIKETDTCFRCGKTLRDYDDFPPIKVSGRGEMCSECYGELNQSEKYTYFGGM